MEKVKFILKPTYFRREYINEIDGDQSGEYVRAEIAEDLLATLKKIVASGGRENVMQIAMPIIAKYEK